MNRFTVLGLNREELVAALSGLGEASYRAAQVMEWAYRKGARDFTAMSNLPKSLRERLAEVADVGRLSPVAVQRSQEDDTTKVLLRLSDGETVEAVLLPHDYGVSACVSSQVGCAMGCAFCASTRNGFRRNLTAGEMLAEVLEVQTLGGAGTRVSHVVIMGTGEPLLNLNEVLRFLRLLHDEDGLGISYRNLTLSTCGLVPEMRRLAEEGLPLTLAVSLHAPNDELRSRLMPVNRKYPIATLLAACDEYGELTGRRVTFEYALIAGTNDHPGQARELAERLRGMLCHVNLIPLNAVPESGLERSSPGRVEEFRSILVEAGIPVTVRREMGADIEAACGQLRRRVLEGGDP